MTKKSKTIINLVIGIISQIVVLILGLIVPRIVLINYGSDTNGLTSTIVQIFTYMALLEAGISVSARNAFYKPIKEHDVESISLVASLAKRYYKKISIVYLFVIVAMSFILPLVLKTSVPYLTINIYILFEGLSSLITFYFINTWTTFLKANGNTYIINILSLFNRVLCYIVKIILSLNAINIAFIQIGYFLVSLLQLYIYYIYMQKRFGWIKYNMDTGDTELPDKNANLISEIAWVVFSSTDMIILSIFISTSSSSVYSVYNMIFLALSGLLNALYTSVNYHLGLEYNSGNICQYIKLHDTFMVVFVGAISALMSSCYLLIIPFVKLYTREITDVNYIYTLLPLLFCLVQIFSWSRYVSGNLIGISFRQKPAIKINVLEAFINISLSLILVRKMGIEGVLLATVIALPLKVIYCTYIADIVVLKRSPKRTILTLGTNYALFFICVLANYFVYRLNISNYIIFLKYGILIFSIICVLFGIPNGFLIKRVVSETDYTVLSDHTNHTVQNGAK